MRAIENNATHTKQSEMHYNTHRDENEFGFEFITDSVFNPFLSDEKNFHTRPLETLSLQFNRKHAFVTLLFVTRSTGAGHKKIQE